MQNQEAEEAKEDVLDVVVFEHRPIRPIRHIIATNVHMEPLNVLPDALNRHIVRKQALRVVEVRDEPVSDEWEEGAPKNFVLLLPPKVEEDGVEEL